MGSDYIHPQTMKVVNYPETIGKKIALKYFNWMKLDKVEESYVANRLLALAELIDSEIKNGL